MTSYQFHRPMQHKPESDIPLSLLHWLEASHKFCLHSRGEDYIRAWTQRGRGSIATLKSVHHKQHLGIFFRAARSWHELKGRVCGNWKQSENFPFPQFLYFKTTTSVYLVTLIIIQTVGIRDPHWAEEDTMILCQAFSSRRKWLWEVCLNPRKTPLYWQRGIIISIYLES